MALTPTDSLKLLLGKEVTIVLKSGGTHKGTLKAIDDNTNITVILDGNETAISGGNILSISS